MIGRFIFVLRWNAIPLGQTSGIRPLTPRAVIQSIGSELLCNSAAMESSPPSSRKSAPSSEVNRKYLAKECGFSKFLQSLAGKLSDGARLLTTWRPFLCDHWAALAGGTPPGALRGCIWTKQFRRALL